MQRYSAEASSSRQQQDQRMPIFRSERGPPPPLPPPKVREKSRDNRVARACKTCRKRKVRCSGDQPCSNCQQNDSECVYEQARRDRLKESTNLNHALVSILRDLSGRVGDEDRQKIEDALEDVEEDLMSHTTNMSVISLGKRDRQHSTNDDDQATVPRGAAKGEAHVTASAGSNEDLDHLDEDLMRDPGSRATGYVGQNSEIQWLRSVQRQTEHPSAEPRGQPHGPPGSSQNAVAARSNALHERRDNAKADDRQGSMRNITDSTFYLDGEDIQVEFFVDPNEVPHPDEAERLFNCYYETVHPSFPLVPDAFEVEFRKYLKTLRDGGPDQVSQKWRAQLNLLFAIGAKHSHLIGANWQGHDRDHLLYMNRATQLLGLNNITMITSGPDITLIQATAALAFYFLAIGHVSKAWIIIGISIRLALAVGLHLRNEDPTASESKKEILVHTWWSLHSIECLVSSITGRPPVIAFEDCTVPLPHSLSGEQPISTDTSRQASKRRVDPDSSRSAQSNKIAEGDRRDTARHRYLFGHVRITLMAQKALFELYSPRTATRSWKFMQEKILELLEELAEWKTNALPMDHQAGKGEQRAELEREQFLLRTNYWSTKILITRPCLCRIERRIQNESSYSAEFNKTTAKACVEAALEITHLFPDKPDLNFLYTKGPWWTIVHLIMQAVAVLLLEMVYKNRDMKSSEQSMTISIKKLLRWLRAMQHNDPVAGQAFAVIYKILIGCDPALQAQANEILALDDCNDRDSLPELHGLPNDISGTSSAPQVSPSDSYPNFMNTSSTYGAPFFQQQQPLNPMAGYEDDLHQFFPSDEQMMPMAFGTPFYTRFDEGAPVINMQDLWANTTSSNTFDSSFARIDLTQIGNEEQDDNTIRLPLHQRSPYRYQDPRE